ncbi:Lipoamide acyltransferase component of branched-chain alpha-keto acid dehydrogenase complex, mitochondrial [Toxocara canis]|uniref:Dihydrolipoamide acetyltransferase component of pyruvate dehydrogenase complex n=1 Tax=Toxocara canis TaxID=6265 RepID=A0A0B2W4Z0_TOXCA|nr:Lipoamide acyltransferase component of branched-chain alpha-keto acid dehydrogenase complex, mitochondrial [Toxocara canis]
MASFICRQLIGKSSRALTCTRFIHTTLSRFLPTVQFKLSDIGEGIAEVQVKEWHVKVGDRVSQFDNLCEVQSDKATVTITSRYDGVIKKLYYNVDDVAKIGSTLIDIEVEEGAAAGAAAPEAKAEDRSAAEVHEEETASSSAETTHATGKALATPAVRRIAIEHNVDLSKVHGSGKDGRVLKEDILRFVGDLAPASSAKAQPQPSTAKAQPLQAPISAAPVKTFMPLKADQTKPIRGYTRVMIKSMSEALKIPHFGYNDEIVMSRAIEMRNDLKELSKERGIKMTYTPIFIKAASLALRQFPGINATVDDKLENITYKASHNICVAMDTPDGLIVPNIKNCEQRNIWEIAEELNRLVHDARRGAVAPHDLAGGTFTISNIGAIGGTYAGPIIFPPQLAIVAFGKMQRVPHVADNGNIGGTYAGPIIFPPQLAIVAFGKMQRVPHVADNGNVEVVDVVKLSFAADHRFIDGATVARFSNALKMYVEKPNVMAADLA